MIIRIEPELDERSQRYFLEIYYPADPSVHHGLSALREPVLQPSRTCSQSWRPRPALPAAGPP